MAATTKRPNVLVLYALGVSVAHHEDLHVLGNNDMWRLLDPSRYQVDRLILRPERMAELKRMDFSHYDVVINAISDPDINAEGLTLAHEMCIKIGLPIINQPLDVLLTGRDRVAESLSAIDGFLVPKTGRVSGRTLRHEPPNASDFNWPLLCRPVGDHGAVQLRRFEMPDDFAAFAASLNGDRDYYLTEFIDCARPDGRYWKTRVVIIEGEPMIRHVVISDQWISNTDNQGQNIQDQERQEHDEVAAMAAAYEYFTSQKGRQMVGALHEKLRLDYIGLDCAQLPDGRWVVFEANATMNMLPLRRPKSQVYINIIRRLSKMLSQAVDNRLASSKTQTAS